MTDVQTRIKITKPRWSAAASKNALATVQQVRTTRLAAPFDRLYVVLTDAGRTEYVYVSEFEEVSNANS